MTTIHIAVKGCHRRKQSWVFGFKNQDTKRTQCMNTVVGETCGQFQLPYLHPVGKDILGQSEKLEDQREYE